MIMLSIDEIVKATGGKLISGSGNVEFSAISIDSRKIKERELFWAIKGDRFDGNDFISGALNNGAAGIVTDSKSDLGENITDIPIIKVASPLEALQKLASFSRQKYPIPLVGITGSNGKTTTKEILATILEGRHKVLKNEGNFNNLIGVPLTLLKLHSGHEVAVIEMGMNKSGEIRVLATMAQPNIGIITNVGEAHLEGLGSIEAIKEAKGELVKALCDEDEIILNADDPAVMGLQSYAKGKVSTFGTNNNADVMASEVEIEWGKGTLFILHAGGKSIPVLLPVYGIHQLYNALAASAAAFSLGFSLHEIREGLEGYQAYSGRMEIISLMGISVINDSYNANPPSVRHAIETMKKLAEKRTIAVLGDMMELGKEEEKIHFDLGCFVASIGVDTLITVGLRASHIANGAIEGGMKRDSVFSFDDRSEATKYLIDEVKEMDWVLIKGSRSMKMEEIASKLVDCLKMREEG